MFRTLLVYLASCIFLSLSSATPFRVAIANLGPHQSLLDLINGIQSKSKELGLDIEFDIQHVNFDMTQISKMLAAQKAKRPNAVVTITTSVSQHAKTVFRGTTMPIIFAAITDPVEAKLLDSPNVSCANLTGVSDQQDVNSVIDFIKYHLKGLKRIGIPYAQNEANDRALLSSFQQAASEKKIEILPIPIESLQDLPQRIRAITSSVDAIYVGPSNLIQPALPAIVQQTNHAKIPVFNFNEAAVKDHQAFGSFSVNYVRLGHAVALILHQLTKKTPISVLSPAYPQATDHYGNVSLKAARKLNIKLPEKPYPHVEYVGE